MTDSNVSRHKASDPAEWVDQYGDVLFRFALSRLRDPDAAEEVVQETFVAALRARHQYSGEGSERAWLTGICRRKIVDYIRRRNRPDAATGGEQDNDPSAEFFDAKGNWRFDPRIMGGRPEAAMEREEFWEAFRSCLKRLPQRQADVFMLREFDELSGDQICKELGITSSNLWVLLHRARLRLTRRMKFHLEKWGVH
ncbi:sigma-70 family RNA polymerase sigma factor [Thermogutta sp.]|uniref:sigma-70 family RNA polymerase sigma factor n=1 Tax=Thermogutta sp. TaxID=1962930 RepID=UPI003C79FB64